MGRKKNRLSLVFAALGIHKQFITNLLGTRIMANPLTDKNSFSKEELIACGHGKIFGEGNALLPLPPMLMFDRITAVTEDGGKHNLGYIEAELDINPDLWFFKCHFKTDPVMPGCLGLDALWQLLGFFLGWKGGLGHGRALGSGEVKFFGQVLPSAKKVTYKVHINRLIMRRLVMGIGDATMGVDGRDIYSAKNLKVGLFTSTAGF